MSRSDDLPEIYAVISQGMPRRRFVATSMVGASLASGLLSSCARPQPEPEPAKALAEAKAWYQDAPEHTDTEPIPDTPAEPVVETQSGPTRPETTRKESCQGLMAHGHEIRALAVSPDGRHLLSASPDRTLKAWNLVEGSLLATRKNYRDSLDDRVDDILALEFCSDSQSFISGSRPSLTGSDKEPCNHTIKRWSFPSMKLIGTAPESVDRVEALRLSADQTLLVALQPDMGKGMVLGLYALPGLARIMTLSWIYRLQCMDISPDGKWIVAGDDNGNLVLWSLPKGTRERDWKGHSEGLSRRIAGVSFSPDGRYLASASFDHSVRLWSFPEGKPLKRLEGHESLVFHVRFSPDGKLLLSVGVDGVVKLWNMPDGTFNKTLAATLSNPLIRDKNEETSSTSAWALTSDSRYLVAGTREGSLLRWRLPEGEVDHCLFDVSRVIKGTRIARYKRQSTNASDPSCPAHTVCTCNTVGLPATAAVPRDALCTCNTVATGTHSGRNDFGENRTGSGSTSTYYHPN